jgi:hypothetical protein
MKTLMTEAFSLAEALFQHPASGVEWLVFGGLAGIALFGVMRIAAGAVHIPVLLTARFTIGILLSLLIIAASAVAASGYLVPLAGSRMLQRVFIFGAISLATLIAAVPVLAVTWKTKYLEAFFSLAAGMAAVAIAIAACNGVRGAINAGMKDSIRIRNRHEEVERILQK